jgi:hypothetical protein
MGALLPACMMHKPPEQMADGPCLAFTILQEKVEAQAAEIALLKGTAEVSEWISTLDPQPVSDAEVVAACKAIGWGETTREACRRMMRAALEAAAKVRGGR